MVNSDNKPLVKYVPSEVEDCVVPDGYETTHSYQFFVNYKCQFYPCHKSSIALNCLFCYCPLYHLECPGEYDEIKGGNDLIVKDCSKCMLNHQQDSHEIINKILEFPVPWIPGE
jgi:Zn-finger protein